MHPKTATLFGYTHDEVLKYFPGRIHELAEASGLTDDATFKKIIEDISEYRIENYIYGMSAADLSELLNS